MSWLRTENEPGTDPKRPRFRSPRYGQAVTSRARRVRAQISLALLVVDLMNLGLTLASVHGPIRFALGLVLGLFIPGWTIVGRLRLSNVPLEIGLTIAVSLALLMIGAQILITTHLWHLGGFEDAVCLACLPLLAWLSFGAR